MTATETYDAAYRRWQTDPEGWWRDAATAIDWTKPFDTVFDADGGSFGRWFPGGELNTCFNCLDRHVANGRGSQDALIWDSPLAGEKRRYTYEALLDLTARFAGALQEAGVAKGDRVLLYMPMIPEAAIAMLACARIGAIHSVVFGGFAPAELAARITDATPKVIVTASCGIEPGRVLAYKPLLEQALAVSAHSPQTCFIVQRPILTAELTPGRDRDFGKALDSAPCAPLSVASEHPLYILYTSGTTGKPKGIVRDTGGHAVALMRTMRMVYGVKAGDTFWAASDIGWVVGHSYIVYAPLLAGCTTVLYEGKPIKTPDAGAFWRVCEDYGVNILFTAPTAIRAIRQQDPQGAQTITHDLSSLRAVFLAGERCDPATAVWLAKTLKKPVVDHWWQTETGWAITSGFREFEAFDQPPGSGGRPSPGWTVEVLDEEGEPAVRGQTGDLVLRLPLPPGAAPTLWNDEDGYRSAYLDARPGWYLTGDAGRIDDNGDVWVMGRTDDVINVAGHRLSTGAMEEVLASHPDVVECAVIAIADPLRGHVPLGLFVLRADAARTASEVSSDLVAAVRDRIGPIAVFRLAVPVARLPKTRSGKILRKTLRQIADGVPVAMPSTIEDPAVIGEIQSVFEERRASGGPSVSAG